MYNNKLITHIENSQSEMINALCDFIKIESISDNAKKVGQALDFALKIGHELGFEAKSCLNGQVGVIEAGHGNEIMGILSHVDVVGPGDLSKWRTAPFEPRILDGKIFGRGALDDKGAIIACLYAMKAVCDLGIPLKKKIQLILGTQEEVEWTDMKAYVKEFQLPHYGFTPDGEFPMGNIEKGCIDVTMRFPLSKDTRDGKYLCNIDAGTAANIIPGKCDAQVVEISGGKAVTESLVSSGKSVHSSMPEKGENAIFNMAEKLSTIGLNNNKLLELLNMLYGCFGDIYGSKIGLRSDSEYYNGEYVHRNVFAPTVFKVNGDSAEIIINIRSAYGTKEEDIVKVLDNLAHGCGGEVTKAEILPAVYVSKNKPFVQAFSKAYEEVSGCKNEFAIAYGGSYAKAMPNIVSWGPLFPGEEDTCHEENEYMSIQSLMDNAKIFSVAISKIVLSDESFR